MSHSKAYVTTIALLSFTLFGVLHFQRLEDVSSAEIRLGEFPKAIGEWSGCDISLSERVYEILDTKDVLVREYSNPKGESVGLAVVHCATNRWAFHPPEICYVGGGTELLNRARAQIGIPMSGESASMEANELLMQDKNGDKEIAWYWFAAGNRIFSSYLRQQSAIVWGELRRNPQGGALIRVSTRVSENDVTGAEARGKRFIGEMTPLLLNYLDKESRKKSTFLKKSIDNI